MRGSLFIWRCYLLSFYTIGAPANLQFVGRAEASSAQCRKATVMHETAERDCSRHFQNLEEKSSGFFVFVLFLPNTVPLFVSGELQCWVKGEQGEYQISLTSIIVCLPTLPQTQYRGNRCVLLCG